MENMLARMETKRDLNAVSSTQWPVTMLPIKSNTYLKNNGSVKCLPTSLQKNARHFKEVYLKTFCLDLNEQEEL